MKTPPPLRLIMLVPVLAASVLLALVLGSVPLPPKEVLLALFAGASPGEEFSLATLIVQQVRLPRVLTAAGAGGALALAGLLMQTVFRNPLAGPGVLGVSAGAGLGVAFVILAGVGAGLAAPTVTAAIAGAMAVLVVVMIVHQVVRQPVVVLVLGLLFGYAASAITTILLAGSAVDGLERYVQWSFGSFALAPGAGPLTLLLATLVITLPLTVVAPRLDALLLGSSYAESLGIHAQRLERTLLLTAGVLTGIVTALTGPISFLGVAVPHIARGYLHTSRHRLLVPTTVLIGAILAILADLLARLPGSEATLPLNAVLAVLGVPVVLIVVLRPQQGGIQT